MKVHLFKDNHIFMIGITYMKNMFVDGGHALTFSFLKWDLEFEW